MSNSHIFHEPQDVPKVTAERSVTYSDRLHAVTSAEFKKWHVQ